MRPTFAEKDSPGDFMGLEGRTAMAPIIAFFAGLVLSTIAISMRQAPIIPSLVLGALPGTFATFVVLKFVNGKPTGYLRDWITSTTGQAHISFKNHKLSPYVDE